MRNVLIFFAVIQIMIVGAWVFQADDLFGALSPIQVSQGGTGSTTLSGVLAGNGVNALKTVVVGSGLTWDGSTLSSTVTDTNYLTSSGSNTYLNTGSNLQAPRFEATSTTASIFPYASSTAYTITNLFAGTIHSGTWNGTAIGDAYLTKSGDWTGTIDGNNFAGGAIGAGDMLYGGGAGSLSELTIGASSTIMTTDGTSPRWLAGSALCVAITGSSALCDGDDATGVGGGTTEPIHWLHNGTYAWSSSTISFPAAVSTSTATSTFTGPLIAPLIDNGGTVYNVKSQGAICNGVNDDTSAINTTLALGGITFFPAGTCLVTTLTLPSGAHLRGVGHGYYSTTTPSTQRSIIKLKNTTNADLITIPDGRPYGIIENLELDGNKANNTSGIGIDFSDSGTAGEAAWKLSNIEVYNTAGLSIYVGTNRQAVYGDHVIITGSGEHGIQIKGSDSTWNKLMVGSSAWSNIVAQGYVTRLIGGDTWSAGDQGIVVVAPFVSITDMGVDRNNKNGVLIDSGASHTTIKGVLFHSNSQSADNTYSDININNSDGTFNIVGNTFGPLDSGITNKRKYAIDTNGSNTANVGINSHTSSASATGFTDSGSNASLSLPTGTFIKSGSNVIFGGNGFNTLFRPDSSGGDIQFQSYAGDNNSYFKDNGYVGIGTSSPYSKLSVAGQVVASNYIATTTTASVLPYASSTAYTVTDIWTGTIKSGTWNGSTIGIAYGGTNATSFGSHMLLSFNGTSIVSTSTPVVGSIYASSTTATSTFNGGVDLSGANVKMHKYKSFTWPAGTANATTTTATTTIPIGTSYVASTFNGGQCWSGSGTIQYQISDGTNKTTTRAATTTVSQFAHSTNNTFTAQEKQFIEIGPMTASYLSCTFDITEN